jgi:hypothetical protein
MENIFAVIVKYGKIPVNCTTIQEKEQLSLLDVKIKSCRLSQNGPLGPGQDNSNRDKHSGSADKDLVKGWSFFIWGI